MKKLLFLFFAITGANILISQTNLSEYDLLKSKEKSDDEILNSKMNMKSSTWQQRGDLFLDIAKFQNADIFPGMPLERIICFENSYVNATRAGSDAEWNIKVSQDLVETPFIRLQGKPISINTNGAEKELIFERIKLYYINNNLEYWEVTKPIDPDAINKAYDAYSKAEELDKEGKLKTNNDYIEKLHDLELLFFYRTWNLLKINNSSLADSSIKRAFDIDQRIDNIIENYVETRKSQIQVRASILESMFAIAGDYAYKRKYFSSAEKCYNRELMLCIKSKRGNSTRRPYSSLSKVYGKKSQPDKQSICIENYFSSNQPEEDIKELTKAPKEHLQFIKTYPQYAKDFPEGYISRFYNAIGVLYDTMEKYSKGKYTDSQKKEFHDLAISNYKTALKIQHEYFQPIFNLGSIYFNEGTLIINDAEKLSTTDKSEFEKLQNLARNKFKEAVFYMEKAYQFPLNERTTVLEFEEPLINDRSILEKLLTMYSYLQISDKEKDVQLKLNNLPAENN